MRERVSLLIFYGATIRRCLQNVLRQVPRQDLVVLVNSVDRSPRYTLKMPFPGRMHRSCCSRIPVNSPQNKTGAPAVQTPLLIAVWLQLLIPPYACGELVRPLRAHGRIVIFCIRYLLRLAIAQAARNGSTGDITRIVHRR